MSADKCDHGLEWKLACADCGVAAVPWRNRLCALHMTVAELMHEREQLRQMVHSMIIGVHPLPWTVEQDWSWEVYDSQHVIVGKFQTQTAATDFVAFAQELDAELVVRAQELEAELASALEGKGL